MGGIPMSYQRSKGDRHNRSWGEDRLNSHENRKKNWKQRREPDGSVEAGRRDAGEFDD